MTKKKKLKMWSESIIIKEIQKLHEKGAYLDRRGVDPKLYEAAYRYFGGWNNALIAAGLNPYKVKRHTRKRKPVTPAATLSKVQNILKMVYYICSYPGMTGTKLAEKLGVSRNTITRYLEDLRQIPGIEVINVDNTVGYRIRFVVDDEEETKDDTDYEIIIEGQYNIGTYKAKGIESALRLATAMAGHFEDIEYIHIEKEKPAEKTGNYRATEKLPYID